MAAAPPSPATPGPSWREVALVAAALLLLSFAACAPLLVGGDTGFGIDLRYHQFPMRQALASGLSSGELPLWWPELRCGYPVHAYGEGGLLYPLNAPLWLLLGVPQASDVQAWLHCALAGAAAFALARLLGLRRQGAALVGLVFTLGGATVGLAGWPNALASQAWSLWALVATTALAVRVAARDPAGARRLAAGAALLWGLAVLGGRAQRVYVLGWCAPVLAAVVAGQRAPGDRRWRAAGAALAWTLGAATLGLAVAGAQVLPTLELLATSDRAAGLAAAEAGVGRVELASASLRALLAGSTTPALFSGPGAEAAQFPGLVTWVLCAIGLVALVRRRRAPPALLAVLALGAAAAILALGDQTPAFGLARAVVPLLDRFRAPARLLVLSVLAAALLAGWALDRVARGRARGDLARWGLLALLAVELVPYARARLDGRPEGAFQAVDPALLAALSGEGRVAVLGALPLAPFAVPREPEAAARWVAREERLDTNLGAAFGLRHPNGYGALGRVRLERLLRPPQLTPAAVVRRLALAGTRRIATPGGLPPEAGLSAGARAPGLVVQELTVALPDAWLVAEAARVPPGDLDAALARLDAGEGFPTPVLELPELLAGEDPPAPPGAARGRVVRVARPAGGAIRLDVEAPAGGWLVVLEAWSPGWRARVDGAPAPIRLANVAFQAVRVPPGRTKVALDYAPASWRLGWAASLLGLALVGVGLLPALRRQAPGAPVDPGRAA